MEWVEQIKAHTKPILILIEGVLMYFDPEEVKAFFLSLCQRLPKATVLFDMLAYSLVGHAKNHDSLCTMDKKQRPEFKWSERG